MTAPEARAGGMDGNARGLLVLAVALGVGFLLLWGGGDSGGGTDVSASSNNQTTETTEAASTDTSTTAAEAASTTVAPSADTRAPADVNVIVLNQLTGGGPPGSAGATTEQIGDAGYTMGTPANAPSSLSVENTTIYYAEDYEAEATQIALLLGKTTDVVAPLSDVELGGVEGDANVVVVLGSDTPPVSSGSDTTSTTSGN